MTRRSRPITPIISEMEFQTKLNKELKNICKAREVAWFVKCSLCKCEALSVHPCTKLGVLEGTCLPWGGRDERILRACRPVSLARVASLSQNIRWKEDERDI